MTYSYETELIFRCAVCNTNTVNFRKLRWRTQVHINYHNSACGRYFILNYILHRKGYPSIPKTQHWWKIPNGPFSWSRSHMVTIMLYVLWLYVGQPFLDFLAGGAVASFEAGDWLEEVPAAGELSGIHCTGYASSSCGYDSNKSLQELQVVAWRLLIVVYLKLNQLYNHYKFVLFYSPCVMPCTCGYLDKQKN